MHESDLEADLWHINHCLFALQLLPIVSHKMKCSLDNNKTSKELIAGSLWKIKNTQVVADDSLALSLICFDH